VPVPFCVELTGNNFAWDVRYPDAEGQQAAGRLVPNGRDVHVPLDTPVVLILRSTDYVYTLEIPEYGLKQIAVPELEFRVEFRPGAVGRLELLGEHLCGQPEKDIEGELIVEPPDRMGTWLTDQPVTSLPSEKAPFVIMPRRTF
jgi:cytochrome c oxidase subunit 2